MSVRASAHTVESASLSTHDVSISFRATARVLRDGAHSASPSSSPTAAEEARTRRLAGAISSAVTDGAHDADVKMEEALLPH